MIQGAGLSWVSELLSVRCFPQSMARGAATMRQEDMATRRQGCGAKRQRKALRHMPAHGWHLWSRVTASRQWRKVGRGCRQTDIIARRGAWGGRNTLRRKRGVENYRHRQNPNPAACDVRLCLLAHPYRCKCIGPTSCYQTVISAA